jgi:hypothetical protein
MLDYIYCIKYMLIHKYFVFLECCKCGIPVRGLLHDLSKFRPSEFFPYAKCYYYPNGKRRYSNTGSNCGTNSDMMDLSFEYALLLHQKRNSHHWQYWVIPSPGANKLLPMDNASAKEMLCDWIGAGKAKGDLDFISWYENNKDQMLLHEDTRRWIEEQLKTKYASSLN